MTRRDNKVNVSLFAVVCLQEEVLSLLCTLCGLHPWWSPCHETEGEVRVEETSGAMVAHSRCIQVRKLCQQISIYFQT